MSRERELMLARQLMIQQQNSLRQMEELHQRLVAEGYELSPTGEYVRIAPTAPQSHSSGGPYQRPRT